MGFMNDFAIPWPGFVADMWGTSNAVSTVPVSASFISCTIGWTFYQRFWVMAMLPLLGALVLLVIPVSRCLRSVASSAKRAAGGGTVVGGTWTTYRTGVLALAYLVYPTVSRAAVAVLDCSEDIAGTTYLEKDFRVECGTVTHTVHAVAALAVITVFCIGFPLLTAVLLHRRRVGGRLHDQSTRQQLLFLFQGYKDDCCWWESVVIGRKFMLAAAGVALAGTGRGHQAYVALLVAGVSLLAQLAMRPQASRSTANLEALSLAVSVASLYIGFLFTLGGVGESVEVACVLLLVVINFAFVLWMVRAVAVRSHSTLALRRRSKALHRSKLPQRGVPAGGEADGGVEMAAPARSDTSGRGSRSSFPTGSRRPAPGAVFVNPMLAARAGVAKGAAPNRPGISVAAVAVTSNATSGAK